MFLLAVGILAVLWALQITFLKPYYRNMKVNDIRYVAAVIEDELKQDRLGENISSIVIGNNVCTSVYNSKNTRVYLLDSLGVNCYLTRSDFSGGQPMIEDLINEAKAAQGQEFYFTFQSVNFRQEMILYGKEVQANLTNYYVFVNAPIEPLDSTISILQDQFIYVTVVVMILAAFVSMIISSQISRPLAKMTDSARKLAKGDVRVKFDTDGYSEATELAQTLNFATGELAKMDDLRKDLVANVSHDIKTPLTMIKAYAEMIKDLSGNNPQKRDEHLDIILHEANHLDRLVNDMLQLSQYQSQSLNINEAPIHVLTMIKNVVQLFTGFTENNQCTIEIEVDEALMAIADEIKISQVLYNFVNNAIRHMGDDQKVIIKAYSKKEKIRVEVIDHGEGIEDSELPYIWDRYYKVNKHFTRASQGTGLGLAIAKSICEASKIDFGVISEVNKGTTFYFELNDIG